MKKAIDLWAHTGEILETVGKGVLLTTKVGDRVNTMTIGWGTLGIEWKTPIFTAFVRESRLTREFLDKNPEFTVNIPVVGDVKEILGCAVPAPAGKWTKSPSWGFIWRSRSISACRASGSCL